MQQGYFESIIDSRLEKIQNILTKKGKEYVPEDLDDDRLRAFKHAAEIQGINPVQALAGMMCKHTASIYDMCACDEKEHYKLDLWDEKITDHINYLLLLWALLVENRESKTRAGCIGGAE